MKKMPTLYSREFENHKLVKITSKTPIEGLEWVEKGEGIATVKIDGSCCAIIDGKLYKRYDAKRGKPVPADAIPCQPEADAVTGHLPCWRPCSETSPDDKYFREAMQNAVSKNNGQPLPDGTYEAIGPKFNGNPYQLETDCSHGQARGVLIAKCSL